MPVPCVLRQIARMATVMAPTAATMVAVFALSSLAGAASAQALPLAGDPAAAQVEQAAQEWIGRYVEEHRLTDADTSVTVVPPRRAAPTCGEAYNVSPADTKVLTRMRFSVRCPGTSRASVYVVRAHIKTPVVVTASALLANQPLTADDVALEVRDLALTPDALLDPAAVVGRAPRRALKAGQVVQARILKGVVVVRRGQAVQIVANAGPIEVTSAGTAMQDGAIDDVIRVKNVSTSKVITARITGAGIVEPVGTAK